MAQQQQPQWTSRPEIDTNYGWTNHRAQNVTCLATHGTKLLAGSADGRITTYDLEKRSEIATYRHLLACGDHLAAATTEVLWGAPGFTTAASS